MRSMYFEGRRRLVPAGLGANPQTDDTGQFRVLGLGTILEKVLEKTVRDSYEKATAFTNEWIRTMPKA